MITSFYVVIVFPYMSELLLLNFENIQKLPPYNLNLKVDLYTIQPKKKDKTIRKHERASTKPEKNLIKNQTSSQLKQKQLELHLHRGQ